MMERAHPTRGAAKRPRRFVIPVSYRIIHKMKLPILIPGRFVRRDNRFRVAVQIGGKTVAAHLPNSGRLTELLTPGRACWLAKFADAPKRKTSFDLKLVEYAGVLVSVDARLPNPLFAEAVAARQLAPFRGYDHVSREVRRGESRLDFRLGETAAVYWVEVKSVTLVENGTARFPDAPTLRGTRHLRELTAAVQQGEQAAVVFVVQRQDAQRFAPHEQADAAFAATLRDAASAGVGVYAWTCEVGTQAMTVATQIPVDLSQTQERHLCCKPPSKPPDRPAN
jgi:sugar fermentation stimulation protein A